MRNNKGKIEEKEHEKENFSGNELIDGRKKMLSEREIISESWEDRNVHREIIEMKENYSRS